jgi:PAS domain S-box-containing protein
MMMTESIDDLLKKIEDLEERLADSEQLIDAIRAGEVDAFAVNENNHPEIYTLQSGDYAYRVLIEEIGEGAVNISEEGLIVYTNSSFTELIGVPYEKVIGRFMSDFVHEDSKEKFVKLFNESLHGRSKGEIILSAGANIIPVYISLTSLQPKLATVGIIVTDQTRIKLHERTILQYQRELELKNIELAQNNSELSSFTYIASHDLQEPLRKIQTFCNLINTGSNEELPAITRDYFQRILKASTRMQNLISSLLNYSRMNSRGMDFEMTDLNNVLDDACNNMRELLEESQAIIEHDPLPVIPCVPMQISQLFTNLIINSIKYKAAGTAPRIRISACLAEPGEINSQDIVSEERRYWKIIFSDNGIGLEKQYADRIFELFQRLHSRFEYEGTGIGLAICKKIVQNHKGFISAAGKPGLGATFVIYLPSTR